jgi:leucyl aminopeptidase
LPLPEAYRKDLDSEIADLKNISGTRGGGALTAGLFLAEFAGDVPWAHLDLASVGDSPAESFEWTTGPSGFGARALLTWLTGPDPLAGIG